MKKYQINIQFGGHKNEETIGVLSGTLDEMRAIAKIAFDYHRVFNSNLFSGVFVDEEGTANNVFSIEK